MFSLVPDGSNSLSSFLGGFIHIAYPDICTLPLERGTSYGLRISKRNLLQTITFPRVSLLL